MKLHELRPAKGTIKSARRKGRGIASGLGKTAGRGTKGQKARSRRGSRPTFEGGQMPLVRRMPKYGFTNIFKKEYTTINVEVLNRFEDGTKINAEFLKDQGLIKNIKKDGLKILGDGNLEKNLTVKAAKFTKSAVEKIEAAGGKVEEVM